MPNQSLTEVPLQPNSPFDKAGNWLRKKGSRIATGIGAAVLAASPLVTTGCAPSVDATPAASASATPGGEAQSPSPSPESSLDAAIEAYSKLDGEDFYNLPRDMQLATIWKKFYVPELDDRTGSGVIGQYNGTILDEFNPAKRPATREDSGSVIMGMLSFQNAMTLCWPADGYNPSAIASQPLNDRAYNQLLAGWSYYTKKGQADSLMEVYKGYTSGKEPRKTEVSNFPSVVTTATSELKTGIDKDGKQIHYKTLEVVMGGHTYTDDVVFVEFPVDGKIKTMWLRLSSEQIK